MTQGPASPPWLRHAPADLRGSAFGFFNLVSGIATLFASAIAGILWVWLGPVATFACGAVFCGLALIALMGTVSAAGHDSI